MPRRDDDDDDYGFLKGGGGGGLALHSVSMEMKGKRRRRRIGTGESEGDVDGGGDKFPVLSSPVPPPLPLYAWGKEKGGVTAKRRDFNLTPGPPEERMREWKESSVFLPLPTMGRSRQCRARAGLSSPAPLEKAPRSAQTARRADGDLRCPP